MDIYELRYHIRASYEASRVFVRMNGWKLVGNYLMRRSILLRKFIAT